MSPATILVIDDQRDLAELIRRILEREGFEVIIANSGRDGLQVAQEHRPDLVVLDLTMPDLDGLEVCRALRSDPRRRDMPIIVLSARSSAGDRVRGLKLGADDYLVKPFASAELVARVQAVLRRSQGNTQTSPQVRSGELILDILSHSASFQNQPVPLTAAEFRVLELLAKQPGRVFSRDEIIESALGHDAAVTQRTVDAHIVNIRRKLGDGKTYVQTVWGVGYRLQPI
jgi:DNA-binding response OmpR family regulator